MADEATQLRKGVLELAILRLLKSQELYGAQIVAKLSEFPGLNSSAGTIYPILTRLTKAGSLSASWRESPVGPPRKYYAITADGLASLTSQTAAWHTLTLALNSLLGAHHA